MSATLAVVALNNLINSITRYPVILRGMNYLEYTAGLSPIVIQNFRSLFIKGNADDLLFNDL